MSADTPLYLDPAQPLTDRVQDLVSRMTLAEKVSQMKYDAPGIDHLQVPPYNWWNECLHGVGRAGIATVFPQAIGMAATWNEPLMHTIAVTISDEARAKHHEALRNDIHDIYTGLTFWTPNINIFRDPRWGRGQETYGEDPYLTTRMGVQFVRGLQGDNPQYLKLVSTPKHYAVHSGPEHDRHHFDAIASERDMLETYLPAFEATVTEANARSIMGAYNRTNGEACCASPTLLQAILRDRWGFDGYVVSDCWAIKDIYLHHKMVETAAEAAAMAVNAGCDLNCGDTYPALLEAVERGLIDEATINRAVTRLFTARFQLGMFDPPEQVPYAQIPISVNDSEAHKVLALRVARESMVLLKNEGSFLPLSKTLSRIAVIGPNANDEVVLLGNYNGFPSSSVTPLGGIRAAVSPNTTVTYTKGCDILSTREDGFAEAIEQARQADVVIFVGGISQLIEGEEGQAEGVDGEQHSKGDREDIVLPGIQEKLLQTLYETGTPMVLVLLNGSAIAINWADAHLPAIIEAWYPGQAGGTALADVLFGDYNPGGRLPVTFYKSVDDLPDFKDYAMANRTYRYFGGEALYAFGHGLSYTRFAYDKLQLSADTIGVEDSVTVQVEVQNVGAWAGDEVVQLYVSDVKASVPVPRHHLEGFARVHLTPGERKTVRFTLTPRQLALVDDDGNYVVEPGEFAIAVGGRQPGNTPPASEGDEMLVTTLTVA